MNRSADGGFTLIELLVALVLLALLMVTLHGALQVTGRGWERTAHHTRAITDRAHLRHLLRTRLEQARPLRVEDGRGRTYLDFTGTRDSLRFVAPLPRELLPGGDYRLGLTLRGGSLLMAYDPLWWEEPREAPLLNRVEAIRFDYLDGDVWRDEWRNRQTLPTLVRLRISSVDNDAALEVIAEPKGRLPDHGA